MTLQTLGQFDHVRNRVSNSRVGVVVLNTWQGIGYMTIQENKMKRMAPKSVLSKLVWAALLGLLMMPSTASPNPNRIEITANRYAFEPAEITIKTGEAVDLVLASGDVPHGLRIRELNINIKASKGKPGEVKFTPETVGTFIGHCSVFCGAGHGKMKLTIHVVA